MRNIDLTSAYRDIYEEENQLDEVAPLIAAAAGGLAKAGAAKAATAGAAKMGGGLAKAASSKMGKAAINAGSSAVGNSVEKKVNEETELLDEKEGKKDACYNKVKSRFDVWPSAYASGALVKCRQKGAKNWGNSSKKEEVEFYENRRAARAAGGYKDDSKKQTDPSKDGFTGISGSIKDIMRQNKEIEAKNKMKKEELEAVFAVLIGEGIAHNEESAIHIINHMSDEWYDGIVDQILSEG